jgi:hypothetical protein
MTQQRHSFWLEEYPWNHRDGGLGPVELGPWDHDVREAIYADGVTRGRVYSRQRINGRPGILWWKPGFFNYNPIYGPWQLTLSAARELQVNMTRSRGKPFRLFTGSVSESMYRYRHGVPVVSLRFMHWSEWCDFTPKGPFTPASWHAMIDAVYHWIGPGSAAVGLPENIAQLNSFTRSHMFSSQLGPGGANFFAYSFAIPNAPEVDPGLVFIGRGDGARTAATGSNVGNGLPSTLLMVGQDNPSPTPAMLDTASALHAAKVWGAPRPHSMFVPTLCPGDRVRAELPSLN